MKDLVIYGAGGVGRQVAQIVHDINRVSETWRLVGYIDDDPARTLSELNGTPVVDAYSWLVGHPDVDVALAIGSPAPRYRAVAAAIQLGHAHFVTLIHPTALIGMRSLIGRGTIVYAGTVIDPDVCVGDYALVSKLCSLGHDTQIKDYVTMAPGVNIAGAVQVGEGCDLGINCATVQQITIGEWGRIGAGAVVTADLAANVTAVGVPARVIKQRLPGWQHDDS